jgi:hypothetical protein
MGVQINYTGNVGGCVEMHKRGKKEREKATYILLSRPLAHLPLSRRHYASTLQGISCISKDLVPFL